MPIDDDNAKLIRSKVEGLESSLDRLSQKIDSMEGAIKSLNDKPAPLGAMAKDAEISSQQTGQSIKFADMAEQLRSSVANLNKIAIDQSNKGEHAFVINDMDAEIKGSIQMMDGDVCLFQLPQSKVTPESLSTIRFSLRPISVIKLVDGTKEEKR